MSKRLDELRKQLQAKLDASNSILAAAEGANRNLTADETKAFDAAMADADGLKATIKRVEQQEAAQADQSAATRPHVHDTDLAPTTATASVRVEVQSPPRYGTLKAYTRERFGADAERLAYRAGMWTRATYFGDRKAAQWCRDHGVGYSAALSSSDNTGGATLIPDELSSVILTLRETYGVFRRNAQAWPMASDTLIINRNQSAITPYFVGEATAITSSNPTLDTVQLVAKKLGALVYVPRELAADAIINVGDWVAQSFAYAFALKEDQCGFIGDGTSTYGGIRGLMTKIDDGNHANAIFTGATGHTAFSTLTLADFNGVVGLLPIYARPRAKWYISAVGYANSMQRLQYAGGGNATMDIGAGTAAAFLGFPVELVQVMNTTTGAQTSTCVCALGDLSLAAAFGVRADMTVDTSEHYAFNTDQTAIRAIERFDINVHSLGDTNINSPIIALKTPGS